MGSISPQKVFLRARSIAIIGAGPSGVIAAKYLLAEKAFDEIVLFEQQSKLGGIWNYTCDQIKDSMFGVPQENPHQAPQSPEWKSNLSSKVDAYKRTQQDDSHSTEMKGPQNPNCEPSFLSPLYESLETNIPTNLMTFSDLPYPPSTQLFPSHKTVKEYIASYSKEVEHLIKYETQVVDVSLQHNTPTSPWRLTTSNIRTGTHTEQIFDAVIVANGHFIVPHIPNIPGAKAWNALYPNTITHSKYFRRASDFAHKKVIVIGNSASGSDISAHIAPICTRPLLWSSRSPNRLASSHSTLDALRKPVGEIDHFLPSTRSVVFRDGTCESVVDAIVFATGYLYSLPFLEKVSPRLITTGQRVRHTYQYLFFAPQPTLSFLALNRNIVPFATAEAQSAVLARVYSGRMGVPAREEMERWEEERLKEAGGEKGFHALPFPRDGEYINEMAKWALSAPRRERGGDGWHRGELENGGQGKVPRMWEEEDFWCRERFPAVRRAYGEGGEGRRKVTRMEELGFDYRAWREEEKKKQRGEKEEAQE